MDKKCSAQTVYSQTDVSVRGTVTNELGETLIGVFVPALHKVTAEGLNIPRSEKLFQ